MLHCGVYTGFRARHPTTQPVHRPPKARRLFSSQDYRAFFVSSIEAIHVSSAARDLATGLIQQPIWWHLAWQEIQQRYRRSLLGPFWITLSTGIMVAAMGPLYGTLLNQPSGPYLRYLSVGLVIWTFLSGYLNEVCFAFISSAGLIKEVKIPFSTYVAKTLAKHLIVFGHNLVIIVCVLLLFPPPSFAPAPLAAIGLLVVVLNAFGIGLLLAILCARFRDIPQIVGNFVQVLFFLTPVMWQVSMLGTNQSVRGLEYRLSFYSGRTRAAVGRNDSAPVLDGDMWNLRGGHSAFVLPVCKIPQPYQLLGLRAWRSFKRTM